ncbi:DUF551 domain-containing protein [Klebsiella variicola]
MQIDWICNTCATIYHTANDDVAQGYIGEIRATLERMKSIDTAQPAPEYPETLPCPVLLEPGLRFGKGIKTSTMLAALSRRAVRESDMAALSPEERAEFQAGIEDVKALIAQPAPIVQCPYPCGWDTLNKLAIQDAAFVALALVAGEPATESIRQAAITNSDRLLKVISACRAAMLHAQSDDDGEPTDDERIMAIEGIHNCERCGDEGWVVGEMGITRCACNQGNPVFKIDLNSDFIKHVKAVSEKVRAGNSPAIPDGYVMVPKEATLDMIKSGASAASNGMLIPGIYKAMLAAAECSIPMISDTWIPVSEQMPELGVRVLLYFSDYGGHIEDVCIVDEGDGPYHYFFYGDAISHEPTHWMPLPAGPREVKGE